MMVVQCAQLLLLLISLPVTIQFNGRTHAFEEAFKKPMVVPAAEKDYHYTMHEVDTNGGTSVYAKIGVVLLDGDFVFSGVSEEFLDYRRKGKPFACHPFYGSGVSHRCNEEYFVLTSDHILMHREIVGHKTQNVADPCKGITYYGGGNEVKAKGAVGYGTRLLMMFKADNQYNKCIGTYDTDDDMFWCMYPNPTTKTFKPLRLPGFLFDPITGKRREDHAGGQVEVFCKFPHAFNLGK